MSIEFRGENIPVTLAPQPSIEDAMSSELIPKWLDSMDPSLDVQKIELQSVDKFSSGRVGFIKFKSTTIKNGVEVPGIVVLRGPAVSLFLIIEDEETHEKYTVLTRQPRVPTGLLMLELPAGMVDGNGNLKGVAIRELEEECGLVAKEKDLVDLTQLAFGDSAPGVYTECGLGDEYLRMFLWQTSMSHDKIVEINGRLGGVSEHEQIILKIIKLEDLWNMTPDCKALTSLYLYKKLKAQGKL